VVHGLEALAARPAGCAATVGNFDGVHLGHQRILAQGRAQADARGSQLVALTFEPAPVRLLAPDKAPEPLMHLDQRCRALQEAGADVVIVLHTTAEFLSMSPETFVQQVLVERLGAAAVVEGDNFFFGHNRAGNVQVLRELGEKLDFSVQVVEPVLTELDGQPVRISSSLVRRLVREGRIQEANHCLGRPYALRGVGVKGQGRGESLGFPTANLNCGQQLLPADGVYAGRAIVGDSTYLAAVSVGTRPTFGRLSRAVEAYLLEYAGGPLYGSTLEVQLARRLRGQVKYGNVEDLLSQMEQDVQNVRELYKQ
jgi:riboflavin kinase / FMN adenylyltransferase